MTPEGAATRKWEDRYVTPPEELFRIHQLTCDNALETMRAKNHDYATAGGKQDALANFRLAGEMGLCSDEQGILVRLSDKLRRLASFCTGDPLQVEDEKVEDTIEDAINYLILLKARVWERRRETYVPHEHDKAFTRLYAPAVLSAFEEAATLEDAPVGVRKATTSTTCLVCGSKMEIPKEPLFAGGADFRKIRTCQECANHAQ